MSNVNVTESVQTTRTMSLTEDEVMGIIEEWVIANKGFSNPNIDALCSHGGFFGGVDVYETTLTPVDHKTGNWDDEEVLEDRPDHL
jgi:hypothetical protein